MNNQLKLTWKYFIQLKIKEIVLITIISAIIIFIPYFLGNSIGDNRSKYCTWTENYYEIDCTLGWIWGEGFLYIIGGVVTIIVIGSLLYLWFSCNWDNAREKAKKELKTSQKRRRTK